MSQTNLVLRAQKPQPEDATRLTQQEVAGPAQESVWRAHQQPVYRPPNARYSQVPSRMPQLGEPSSSQASVHRELISRATFVYIGFTPRAATKMWSAWINWPSGWIRRETDPDDGRACISFLFFIMRHIIYAEDASYFEPEEWRPCMDEYGLSKATQDSVLAYISKHPELPRWNCSRWSATLVNLRYEELQRLQEASSNRTQSSHTQDRLQLSRTARQRGYYPWNPKLPASAPKRHPWR